MIQRESQSKTSSFSKPQSLLALQKCSPNFIMSDLCTKSRPKHVFRHEEAQNPPNRTFSRCGIATLRFLSAPRLPGTRTPLKLGARVLAFNGWCLDTHFTSGPVSSARRPRRLRWFFMLGIMEEGNSNTKKNYWL